MHNKMKWISNSLRACKFANFGFMIHESKHLRYHTELFRRWWVFAWKRIENDGIVQISGESALLPNIRLIRNRTERNKNVSLTRELTQCLSRAIDSKCDLINTHSDPLSTRVVFILIWCFFPSFSSFHVHWNVAEILIKIPIPNPIPIPIFPSSVFSPQSMTGVRSEWFLVLRSLKRYFFQLMTTK